eukprot:CAMPEP_0119324624 /NCGR_PEP_ID=MMETSP1333-20130426/63773_1 /TAXON_ID=418940 /ORGANISM="Scyphosphaera apsteinii, Strain RCC1455" /LENGTH=318 /DNA_ID=CAMNT_0007332389 /DNA_START=35 /DNA_END=991 /DNA_ORIENTATION=+
MASVDELPTRCVLTGPSGSGKTSLLMQYAYSLATLGHNSLFVCKSQAKLAAHPPVRPGSNESRSHTEDAALLRRIRIKYVQNEADLFKLLTNMAYSDDVHALLIDDLHDICMASACSPAGSTPSSVGSPGKHGQNQTMMHLAAAVALATHAVDAIDQGRSAGENSFVRRCCFGRGARSIGSDGSEQCDAELEASRRAQAREASVETQEGIQASPASEPRCALLVSCASVAGVDLALFSRNLPVLMRVSRGNPEGPHPLSLSISAPHVAPHRCFRYGIQRDHMTLLGLPVGIGYHDVGIGDRDEHMITPGCIRKRRLYD